MIMDEEARDIAIVLPDKITAALNGLKAVYLIAESVPEETGYREALCWAVYQLLDQLAEIEDIQQRQYELVCGPNLQAVE